MAGQARRRRICMEHSVIKVKNVRLSKFLGTYHNTRAIKAPTECILMLRIIIH